jgi:F0F1-type ATP synthase membrane subunit b/b'
MTTTSFRPDQEGTVDTLRRIKGLKNRSALVQHMIDEYARDHAEAIAKYEAEREAARIRAWAMINQARAARKAQLAGDQQDTA